MWPWPPARWIEYALVLAAFQVHFIGSLGRVDLHLDESQWIATSSMLERFLDADPGAIQWQENYWTLTQPPVARYVIGVGRRIGGWGAFDLNTPWNYYADLMTNIEAGAMPSASLLWYARLPMAILAGLAGAIGFFLLVQLAGRVAGYLWLASVLCSAYLERTLTRAMSESPLLCADLAAALLCWVALVLISRGARRDLGWAVLAVVASALACGIAAATKLTGWTMLGLPLGVSLWAAMGLVRGPRRAPRWCVSAPLAVGAVAFLTFVALNPYLYPAPLARTARMIEYRVDEMRGQRYADPQRAMPSGVARVRRVGARVLHDYLPFSADGAGALNAVLAALGLGFAASVAWSGGPRPQARAAAVVLIASAALSAPVVLLSELDTDRYYLLPVVFVMAFSSAGLAMVIDGVRQALMAHTPALPNRTVWSR
jgi:hypothetical protein